MSQEACTFQGGAGVQPPGEAEDLYGVERQTDRHPEIDAMQKSARPMCVVMAGSGGGGTCVMGSVGLWVRMCARAPPALLGLALSPL